MITVGIGNEKVTLDGKSLVHLIREHPEELTRNLDPQTASYVEGLCQRIRACMDCRVAEYYTFSTYSGVQALMYMKGRSEAESMLRRFDFNPDEFFEERGVIYGDQYANGFVNQIDLRCSWHLLAGDHCSKGYCQGLMDAEALENLIETM